MYAFLLMNFRIFSKHHRQHDNIFRMYIASLPALPLSLLCMIKTYTSVKYINILNAQNISKWPRNHKTNKFKCVKTEKYQSFNLYIILYMLYKSIHYSVYYIFVIFSALFLSNYSFDAKYHNILLVTNPIALWIFFLGRNVLKSVWS